MTLRVDYAKAAKKRRRRRKKWSVRPSLDWAAREAEEDIATDDDAHRHSFVYWRKTGSDDDDGDASDNDWLA